MAKDWLIAQPSSSCKAAARRWGVPSIVSQLLINRGVSPDEASQAFLSPQLKDLHAPELLPGAEQAAALIAEAVRAKARIVIYGDYDVDGTTGLAILWHVLDRAGANVGFYVPHRVEEGFGLNLEAAKQLIAEGAELIISVDCGITATDVVSVIREAGVKVVITDHHAPHATVPSANVIVHPTVGGVYPNPDLCGAGVAFKLGWALAQQLSGAERVSGDYRELLVELLPLAALGTIADVVSLRGENRIIAAHGLRLLAQSTLPGVRALVESAGLNGGDINGYDVGFKLAPRINAAGRMGHARLAVELFTRAAPDRAREIALYLEEHNRSRRSAEHKILKEACSIIERDNLAGDARRALVLAREGWHPGVIGIVAARLVDRYHRPTVLIALSNGEGQGSARSIKHFPLADALGECSEYLISHGGHTMAAGLRIAPYCVQPFSDAFVQKANNRLTKHDLTPKLHLDAETSLNALTLSTTEEILKLGPFGMGNPRPRLATDWIELATEPRCVGKSQNHLQASFVQDRMRIKAIGFGLGSQIEDLKQHRRCRVAFEPIINEFRGRRTVEMQMLDIKFPK